MTARAAIVALSALAVAGTLSCRSAAPPPKEPQRDLVVVAPHPDDETLIAAGILEAAGAHGGRVAVIVVTNGDFTCERDGHVRQGETVAALAKLGVAEEDIHFLGYPDGWLAELGDEPLPPSPVVLSMARAPRRPGRTPSEARPTATSTARGPGPRARTKRARWRTISPRSSGAFAHATST